MSVQEQEEIIDFLETESAGFADQGEAETIKIKKKKLSWNKKKAIFLKWKR